MSVAIDHLDQLTDFAGTVIRPGDDSYGEAARTPVAFGAPALVLRPTDPADVRRAVRFAATSGRPIAVRGGGHSFAGLGTNDGGVVLDLAELDTVEVLDDHRVRVGGGVVWRQVADALAPYGLGISSGDTGSVGVGGLTLSGGIGWTVRRDGLALDHLRAVDFVTAAGEVLRADADHHPELFWALRGGGGGFGVITAFEFEARPLGELYFGAITFPATEVERVLPAWADLVQAAPVTVSSTVGLANPFLGGREAPIRISIAATEPEAGQAFVGALRAVGTVLSEDLRPRPYGDVLEPGAQVPPALRFAVRSGFVRPSQATVMTAALTNIAAQEQPAGISVHALGGAMGRVPADATAFAHRDAAFLVATFAAAPVPQLPAVRHRMAEVWKDLEPAVSGTYANFLDGSDPDALAAVHPLRVRERLATVRQQYDPTNVFRTMEVAR